MAKKIDLDSLESPILNVDTQIALDLEEHISESKRFCVSDFGILDYNITIQLHCFACNEYCYHSITAAQLKKILDDYTILECPKCGIRLFAKGKWQSGRQAATKRSGKKTRARRSKRGPALPSMDT